MVDFFGTEFTKTREPRDMIDVNKWHGRVRISTDTIALTAAVAATDRIFMAKLPTRAVIMPISQFHCEE